MGLLIKKERNYNNRTEKDYGLLRSIYYQLFVALIANLLLPLGLGEWISLGLFLLVCYLVSILIGTLESAIARFRMTHVFEFVFIMTLTALLMLALVTYRIYGS